MVIKKNSTRTNTHMKWRGFETVSSSDLHYTNRYEPPNHPMGWSSNRQCIRSITSTNLSLLQRVRISPNGSNTLQYATQPMNSHEHTPVHTTYIHAYIHTHHTPIHIHAMELMHAP